MKREKDERRKGRRGRRGREKKRESVCGKKEKEEGVWEPARMARLIRSCL
jgi:hypothetical protein